MVLLSEQSSVRQSLVALVLELVYVLLSELLSVRLVVALLDNRVPI